MSVSRKDDISLAAIVLCGGRSLRMGEDKASVVLGAETLLQRCCRLISSLADPVVVVAAPTQELPELDNVIEVVRDDFPGEGPLGGLLTGLRHVGKTVANEGCPVWVASCDTPFVNAEVVETMVSELRNFDVVAIRHGDQINPHSAVYRSGAAETVECVFSQGERRASAVFEHLSSKTVSSSVLREIDPDLSFLWNVNTVEDLDRAKARLSEKRVVPRNC
ncbi:MAG: molybdenum cofactor guanylyltransferase [Fuerstiella sp.]|nr:molybdenum cofactor guanylyltransferase [Fuerstiella sp.]MCP4854673.1 molybdenum cofactor guanylyltransferase [Fuerstiella sp.]